MDWKSAKTILIIIFVLLNMVLAGILYRTASVGQISQRTIENTKNILMQNDVLIECPIPRYTGSDYILKNEEHQLDKKLIASVLLGTDYIKISNNTYKSGVKELVFNTDSSFQYTDPGSEREIYTVSKEGIDIYVKDLATQLEIPFEEFRQDGYYPYIKNDKEVQAVYKGFYNGHNVFDNYIDIVVTGSAIESISYQYKKPTSITPRDINIIPAYEILITKVTQNSGITIKDIDLGFKGYTNVDEETKTLYEGLAWRIKTYDGREFYYNARNGEEIG